jgi:hypothetical protein
LVVKGGGYVVVGAVVVVCVVHRIKMVRV